MRSKASQQGCAGGISVLLSVLIALIMVGCNGSNQPELPLPTVKRVNTGYDRMVLPGTLSGKTTRPFSGRWPAGWIPQRGREDRSRWQGIVIHHSATEWGNAAEIDKWHKDRGWEGGGYHFVINNGRGETDGKVEVGFRWRDQMTGAHCRPRGCVNNYWNKHTIGICLVGNFEHYRPSRAQYDALAKLVSFLQERYNIPNSRITTHGEVPGAITACPGKLFNWYEVQRRLGQRNLATR